MTLLAEFARLNGYGIYVWPAFAFAALVLAAMGWRTLARLRAAEAELAAMQAAVRDRALGDAQPRSARKEDR